MDITQFQILSLPRCLTMFYPEGVATTKRGKHEGEYKTLESGRVSWRVRVSYEDGSSARPSGTAKNMTAARQAVRDRLNEAEANQRPVSRTLTVGAMVKEHIDSNRATWKPGYTLRNEYLLERYIMPRLGSLKAVGMTPLALRAHYDHLQEAGLGISGQKQVRSLLSGAYKRAQTDGILRENPTEHARPNAPRQVEKVKAFNPDEARLFFAAAIKDRWALILAFMLLTGLRIGEAVALHWEDVTPDLTTPRRSDGTPGAVWVSVNKTRMEFRGHFAEEGPKTAAGRRMLHVSGDALALLDLMRVKVKEEAEGHGQGVGLYIFPSPLTGKPLLQSTARKAMRRTCQQAGVSLLHPHALRHTYATLGHAQGWNTAALSKQLGHSQISTTMNIYRHDFVDERRGMTLDLSPAKQKLEGDTPRSDAPPRRFRKGGPRLR